MSDLKNLTASVRTSRRHLMKVGAIAGSAVFAGLTKTKLAAADDTNAQGNNGNHYAYGHYNDHHDSDPGSGRASCFLRGTMIRTAEGDRKIEDLVSGDLLPTLFGGICPVEWIGRYPFRRSNPAKAWVKDVLPVRIAKS